MQKIVNSFVFSLLSIALLLSSVQTSFASSSILGTTGNYPWGIVADSSGNIYTANGYSNVSKITPVGVSTILGTTGSNPRGIVLDSSGNVYIANFDSNNVSKITPGGVSSILGTTDLGPWHITIDTDGNVYTTNTFTSNVSKITPEGVSTVLGTTGAGPTGIAIDSSGNIYTANYSANNVSKITPEGVSTILGTTESGPYDIAIDSSGNIYTANSNANNVSKITPEGVSTILGVTGPTPYSMTVDLSGNIYIADFSTNNVYKITQAGVSTIIGTAGSQPRGIAIDSSGNIYTANYGSHNVSKIVDPVHDATIISDVYTISTLGSGIERITGVTFPVSKVDFLANLQKSEINQIWDDSGVADPVGVDNTLVVTAEDGTTIITYIIPEPNHDATVTSGTYTVGTSGGVNRTITNVPFATSQSDFLDNLTKSDPNQTWDYEDEGLINDPVMTGDTLVVTAEDGTTVITYTITTLLDPGVDIDTCTEFEDIDNALSRTYRLTADLDCTGEGNNIMVAVNDPFTGTFDGQNYTITIAINSPNSSNIGLFRQASGATISNLNISGIVRGVNSSYIGSLVGYGGSGLLTINNVISTVGVSGGSYVGGLVGLFYGEALIINSSYSSGSVSGDEYIGGLVGDIEIESGNATITDSHSSGTIDGNYYVGGLLGKINNNQSITTITGSYSTSTVIAYTERAGGLVGYIVNYGNSEAEDTTAVNILNSYHTTGNVSQIGGGGSSVGGLIGNVNTDYTASFNISDSYAEGNVSGPASGDAGGLIGYIYVGSSGAANVNINILRNHYSGTVSSLQDYLGGLIGRLDSSSLNSNYAVSNIIISNNYTTGTISGRYYLGGLIGYSYIGNSGDYGLNLTLNNNYSTSTITSSSGTRSGGLMGDLRLMNNAGEPFAFTFNQNYSTGNISVDGSGSVGGLVGYLYSEDEYNDQISGTFSNNHYSGAITDSLDDSSGVGGLIGYVEIIGNNQLEISDNYSTANVTGYQRVGGLLGFAQNVYITGSYATGNVIAEESSIGGLLGYGNNIYIANSYSNGNVTSSDDGSSIGGLVGNYASGEIRRSFASGNVAGGEYVGGLVGYSNSEIINSYSKGTVTGTSYLGGLIGYQNNDEYDIAYSYAIGLVEGTSDEGIGGLIGYNEGAPVYGLYYGETTGQTDTGKGILKTTTEMKTQATFQPGDEDEDWDFEDIWGIDTTLVKNSGYPYLQWESYPSATVASPVAGTYSDTQTITLTATGSTSIRYSTLATPADCASGTLYTAPLSVSESQTIYTRACNSIGNSTPKSFVYTISRPSGGGGGGSSYIPPVVIPPASNTPIICLQGQIFSTTTGQRCTSWEGNTNSSRTYNFGNTTLRLGSRGEAVKELQRFLNDTLNLGLVIDGKLGPKTIVVIKKWQKDHGLVSDGLVGKKTKDIMNGKI